MNNDFFGHSWGDLPMIFTRDFVTRENHCHGNSCIILYIKNPPNSKRVPPLSTAPFVPPYTENVIPHYNDVIMSTMAPQITCVSIVCLTVCSGADQRKHQSPAPLAFVGESTWRWPVDSPHKGTVTRKMFQWRHHAQVPIQPDIADGFLLIWIQSICPGLKEFHWCRGITGTENLELSWCWLYRH